MTSRNEFGRRRWSGIAVGALVVVLAACGSQAKTVEVKKKVAPSPRKVLLASVQATTAAKSARLSMRWTANGSGAGGFGMTAEGVTDFTTGDGVLTGNYEGLLAQFMPGESEIRKVDGAVYLKLPGSSGVFGAGQWLKIRDLGDANSALPGLGQSDPSLFLAYLETVSDGVTKVGTEPIRGVETTHYKATLDLTKTIDHANVPAPWGDDVGKGFGKSVETTADVWVDADGIARRIQLTIDLGQLSGIHFPPMTMTMAMDFYDFGVPVHVEAPPADEVTEFPLGRTTFSIGDVSVGS